MTNQSYKGKEPFVCSGCIGKWCETPTTICIPDESVIEEDFTDGDNRTEDTFYCGICGHSPISTYPHNH